MTVLKIIGIILLVLLLLIVLICLSSVAVHVSFWDEKFDWSVRWLGIKILPRKKKIKLETPQKPEKKKDKKSDKKDSGSEKNIQKFPADVILQKLQKLVQKTDMAGSALNALPSAVRWLGKASTWYAIETDIVIANEDASECAKQYGLMQMILQNFLSQTGNFIHVKRKSIRLSYDFTADKNQYQFRCRVKLHIGKTAVAGIVFLKDYLKDSRQAKKAVVQEKL